jgi:hypothetical protein
MVPAEVMAAAVAMLADSCAKLADLVDQLLAVHGFEIGVEVHDGLRQMWITRPNAASTLSCIISLKVGCGKTVAMKSSSTSSAVLPIV